MTIREDRTRIAESIHTFISAFRSSPGVAETECDNPHGPVKVRPLAIPSNNTIDLRLFGDTERKRYSPYLSNLKNQIR